MIETLREFMAMGGYAFYVWSAYALSAVVLAFNAIAPRVRERALLRSIAARTDGERR